MKALFMLFNSLPQASVAETIPPEVRFRSIGGEHRFYLEHERVYTLIKDVSFLDAPKVDAQEVIVPAGHTIAWSGQRHWFNVVHVEPKDCFFVYQVMGDHIDSLTPEGVDTLNEALCLFFANRMWRHCYIEDKNHDVVDISAQIEGFENYLSQWDTDDDYFDSLEYMSDDDPEWDLQCSDDEDDDPEWEDQCNIDDYDPPKPIIPGEAVRFCRKYCPYMPEEECYKAYEIYRMYHDEGQSREVSRMYAGLS